MRKIPIESLIQLLGMLGVIGSLIFVAMQMRQSHLFALAAQQQATSKNGSVCGRSEYDVGNGRQFPRLSS